MRMKRIFTLVVTCVFAVLGLSVSAQAVSLPYQMNFEANEAAELSNWVLNPGGTTSSYVDKWIVGNSVHSAGHQALYISNNDRDAMFDTVPCVQYAYRDILLPAGTYDLTFDWMCVGSSSSSLYVGFTNFANTTLTARTIGSLIPAIKARMLSTYSDLKKQDMWQNASVTVSSDGATTQRLVFAWVNNNRDREACSIGACIDNIVITNANCKRPFNIEAVVTSCDSVTVSWTGTSGSYEFAYRSTSSDTWITKRNIIPLGTQGSFVLTNMSEGSYDFRVRGVCTPDTSAWSYYSNFVVFCPEKHCVNFTDLRDTSTVICTYSDTRCFDNYTSDKNCAYQNQGVVDFGSEAIQSRHTTNWDPAATDPRTGGQLSLIPRGGYASVRLGNWNDDGEAEAISYRYTVDDDHSILLLHYAVVLEDPNHSADEQPRFVLEILDENGNLVDPTCGSCNFAADKTRQGWHTYSSGYDVVTWKDWTTIGLNLTPYIGQRLTVRFSTYDCGQWGHYGYAYFTLDCARAVIETAACAKDPNPSMKLIAPEGFSYQWYHADGSIIPGATSREYMPNDTLEYECVLTNMENADCHFSLRSRSIPRLPYPSFNISMASQDCKNSVLMTNTSYVKIVEKDTVYNLDEKCDSYLWETWGITSDGQSFAPIQSDRESPIFDYPNEGGDFFVKLTATVAGSCVEDTVRTLHLEPITDYSFAFDTVLCRPVNDSTFALYIGDGDKRQRVTTSGVYVIHYKSIVGCDSMVTYNVEINESYQYILPDTAICYGESICYGDSCIGPQSKSLYQSNMWIWDHMRTVAGCDSTIMRKVTVYDPILPVISCNGVVLQQPFDLIEVAEGEVSVDLSISGDGFSTYTVSYMDVNGQRKTDVHTPADVLLEDLPVNEYQFVFSNAYGCELSTTVLVGGDTLCIELLTQIECECGKPVLDIPYRKCPPANKARLATCSVLFSDADKVAQGFTDVLLTSLHDIDTIRIDVPQTAEPGIYDIDLVFDTIVGGCIWGQNAFHTSIKLTYDSSVIFHRWTEDAIISLAGPNLAKKADGSDYELYAFDNFQWLLNGNEVEGANRSYMEHPGKLNMSDAFALRMTRADGLEFTTCSYIPDHNRNARMAGEKPVGVSLTPTDPLAGSPVEIILTDDAEVELYSVMGNKVFARRFSKGISSFSAPAAQGIYIMNVRTRGEVVTLRIRVR